MHGACWRARGCGPTTSERKCFDVSRAEATLHSPPRPGRRHWAGVGAQQHSHGTHKALNQVSGEVDAQTPRVEPYHHLCLNSFFSSPLTSSSQSKRLCKPHRDFHSLAHSVTFHPRLATRSIHPRSIMAVTSDQITANAAANDAVTGIAGIAASTNSVQPQQSFTSKKVCLLRCLGLSIWNSR